VPGVASVISKESSMTHDTSNLTCSGGGAREENGWYQGVKSCCLVSRPKETIRLPLLGGNPGNAGLSLPARY